MENEIAEYNEKLKKQVPLCSDEQIKAMAESIVRRNKEPKSEDELKQEAIMSNYYVGKKVWVYDTFDYLLTEATVTAVSGHYVDIDAYEDSFNLWGSDETSSLYTVLQKYDNQEAACLNHNYDAIKNELLADITETLLADITETIDEVFKLLEKTNKRKKRLEKALKQLNK